MREKRKTDKFGDTGQLRTNTKEAHPRMHSIRTKITLTVVSVIILTVCIVAAIGVISIKKLGSDDADQMIHLRCNNSSCEKARIK